uniref:Uncharacterized protein n=1 Tax=Sciurus vulgaris TaxID=55149 RepID=A0A8D2JG20_SCIVU
MDTPLLSAPDPWVEEAASWLLASSAQASASAWPPARGAAGPSPWVFPRGCCACPWPPGSGVVLGVASPCRGAHALFFSGRWKMEGTAVGLSRRCWSSSLLEKLSLVKCSLQRKEYLVGVQFSL